ncbi:FAD-dependent oxidoreductase [Raoultibacter phocaeensis]|uniref:FAD-dependent oxidoreductase n=1 Tax=Raoultibacter phocaeensis TaxID=2479841 RepID=UPI0015D59919|nr:FAD-dependent oxidoreductase [Raoultibacter phocaeensis]
MREEKTTASAPSTAARLTGEGNALPKADISRRSFLAGAAIAGVNIALFGLAGCAPKASAGSENGQFKAGTYTGVGQGKFAPITVEVAFSETSIESVTVVDHEETKYISDTALETVPAAIVEHQSLGVDAIAGATLTSTAIVAACEECVKQAGGSASKLKGNYEKPAPSTEVIELEADVVIVGAGASGTVAAVNAARLGASKVIVLEKSCNVGGNALVSGGYLEYVFAPDDLREDMTDNFTAELEANLAAAPEIMPAADLAKLTADVEAWRATGSTKVFDSVELHALQYALQGEGAYADMIISCQHIAELDEWLETSGFDFKPLVGIVGYSWPRWTSSVNGTCGQGYFEFYTDMIEQNDYPVEIYLNTPAHELISEGAQVTGVVAQGADGTTYRVTGAKGVILATGGFSGNPDMLREYNTQWDWDPKQIIPTTNAFGHTGDGITMALSVGAATAAMDTQMPFPFADCKNSTDETTVGDDIDCPIVNKEGKRFMNEVLDRFTMTEHIMAQPDQMMFMISDKDTCWIDGEVNRYGRNVENLINQGQLYRADTLEELAGLMGCDPTTFTAEIERYNEIARSGEDPDFGRTNFTEHSPIENPPFYASPRTWAMHITVGGVLVDSGYDYTVLDEDGNRIEGLHAIGETTLGSCGIGVQGEGYAIAQALFG